MSLKPKEKDHEKTSQDIKEKVPKNVYQNSLSDKQKEHHLEQANARRDQAVMACYHPVHGFHTVNFETGKKFFSANPIGKTSEAAVRPCSQCIGCRLEDSRQWAVRLMNEYQMHEKSSFITLTYNEEHLPPNGTLVKKHHADFLKRLRGAIVPELIRFYHCGEYGEKFKRPHYHAIIFGYDFPDKQISSENFRGDKLHTSELLNKLWGKGNCIIGEVTFDSVAYVARYCTKKKTGKKSKLAYENIDLDTGEVLTKQKEYATMSRKPGIGKPWLDAFGKDVYPSDELVLKCGETFKVMRPPKYYDNLYEMENPESFAKIKADRKEAYENSNKTDDTQPRRLTREYIKERQAAKLKRSYENAET